MSKKNPFEKIILKENDYVKPKVEESHLKKNELNIKKSKEIYKNIPTKILNQDIYMKESVREFKKEEKKPIAKYYPILKKDSQLLNDIPKTKIRYIDIIIEKEQKNVYLEDKKELNLNKDDFTKNLNKKALNDDTSKEENELFLNEILDVKHDYRSKTQNEPIQDSKEKLTKNQEHKSTNNNDIKKITNPSMWKNSHKAFKTKDELNELTIYDLIVYLNSIDPNALSRKEQDRLISIVTWKISFLRKLISKNNKKVFLIANYNVAGALEKLLKNIKRKIRN